MLADFGITKLAVREVSNDERAEGDIIGTIVVIRLALSAAAAAGIQGALIALHRGADVRMAAGVASLSLVGTSLLSVVASFEVRLRQYLESIVIVAGEAVETTLIVVFVVQRRPLADLFAATVIGTSLAAVLALAVVLVRYRVVPRFDRRRVVALLRSAAPLAAVGLVGITLVKLDSIMLAAFRSSREVGLYRSGIPAGRVHPHRGRHLRGHDAPAAHPLRGGRTIPGSRCSTPAARRPPWL